MQAQLIAVVGAVGGVGSSTLAALLARARARDGSRTVLVCTGTTGPGLDVLLGTEGRAGARWPDLRHARGALDPADLDGVLPHWEGVEVLGTGTGGTGPVPPEVMAGVLDALGATAGTVVLDVPAARLGEPPPWPTAPSATLLVTGQDVLGVAGALRVRDALPPDGVGLVLRRRRRPQVAPVEAAHVLGVPLVAVLPSDPAVAAATDRGLGPRPTGWRGLPRAVRAVERHVVRADPAHRGRARRRAAP